MQNSTLKEIKFKLPSDIANSVSKKEIVGLLAEKAFGKAEYYRSKCKEMEEKYGTDFKSFKKRWNHPRKISQGGMTCLYGRDMNLHIKNGRRNMRN